MGTTTGAGFSTTFGEPNVGNVKPALATFGAGAAAACKISIDGHN